MSIRLLHNGKRKSHLIHRLVAKAYLPNENNLAEVNHIDGDKTNNNVDNLEWVNRKTNIKHSMEVLGNTQVHFFKKCKLYKGDMLVDSFNSVVSAARFAYEEFGASITSLQKYKVVKDVRIEIEN